LTSELEQQTAPQATANSSSGVTAHKTVVKFNVKEDSTSSAIAADVGSIHQGHKAFPESLPQLNRQPLGGALAHPGRLGQSPQIGLDDRLHQLFGAHRPEQSQGHLRTDAADGPVRGRGQRLLLVGEEAMPFHALHMLEFD
jgi:hypothetical protein